MSQSVPLINEEDCELGGKESLEDDFAYRNNVTQANKNIRMAFLRKVYSILTIQLGITVLIASIFMFTPAIKEFIHSK